MAAQFQYPQSALLDFSPINQATRSYVQGAQMEADGRRQQQQMGMEQEKFGLQKQAMESERQKAFVNRSAGIAQMILEDPDPNRATAQWNRLLQTDKRWGDALSQSGIDPRDFKAGAQAIIAEARGYRDPLETDAKKAQIEASKAQAAAARAQAGDQYGLSGGIVYNRRTGEARPVQSNGLPQLTSTDKQAILDADDARLKAAEAARSARSALQLNSQAYEGPGAGIRGKVMSYLGSEDGLATSKFSDLVGQMTLESLKPIFGGNPTEGERSALNDLQAAVSKPAPQRAAALERLVGLLERREALAAQQAEGIRDGTYYRPRAAQPQGQPQSSGGWSAKRID